MDTKVSSLYRAQHIPTHILPRAGRHPWTTLHGVRGSTVLFRESWQEISLHVFRTDTVFFQIFSI